MIRRGIDELQAERIAAQRPYLEFLRSAALSAGVYVLKVGDRDLQQPHDEDEVYVVIRGRGRFTAGSETSDVVPGDTLFVSAGLPHRFHDIGEELVLVVVFAPPET